MRPHYHALLFNWDFDDRVYFKTSESGCKIYVSEKLSRLWPFGFSSVGDVTFESAAYVARYVMDKVTGDDATRIGKSGLSHYQRVDASTGEVFDVKPEYVTMSRRDGIGKGWYLKFKSDMFPSDFRVVNGAKVLPAKYYSNLFELQSPEEFAIVKKIRSARSEAVWRDNTERRLRVKEECKRARINLLKRGLD